MIAKDYWNTVDQAESKLANIGRLVPPNLLSGGYMPIQLVITPTDPIILKQLKDQNLFVDNPRYINKSVVDIYKWTRIKPSNPFRYAGDQLVTGRTEYFMFPWELRGYKRGDCDDWAIEILSYLIAAGVPEWRCRIVVGEMKSGGAHATVYVLKDDLKNWVLLDSTTGYQPDKYSLNDYDNDVGPAIKTAWYSYNNINCWKGFTELTDIDLTWGENGMKTLLDLRFVAFTQDDDGDWWGAIAISNEDSVAQDVVLKVCDIAGTLVRESTITVQAGETKTIKNYNPELVNLTGALKLYINCSEKVFVETGSSRGTDNAIVWKSLLELPFPK